MNCKKFLVVASACIMGWIGAENVVLPMPFTPGGKTPVAGWKAGSWNKKSSPNSVELKGAGKDSSALIHAGYYLEFNKNIRAVAGDKVAFEIEFKTNTKNNAILLGQRTSDGWWVSQLRYVLKSKPGEFQTVKGELTLTDETKPDKRGVIRKVGKFSFSIYCANNPGTWLEVKNVKLNVIHQ